MDVFFDDFDDGMFMDGDDFEDRFDENCEPEDVFEEGPESAGEPEGTESHEDGFSGREAFMFGVAMGWAYEEGLEEAERRKLEKEMEEDRNREEDSEI
jgi:hypothetical protein